MASIKTNTYLVHRSSRTSRGGSTTDMRQLHSSGKEGSHEAPKRDATITQYQLLVAVLRKFELFEHIVGEPHHHVGTSTSYGQTIVTNTPRISTKYPSHGQSCESSSPPAQNTARYQRPDFTLHAVQSSNTTVVHSTTVRLSRLSRR